MTHHQGDLDDDKYIAELLAEDARKSSLRYAAVGMSALLPKRPTNAAPKPNTRFLKTLVREADSHNAALKKKEELEARIRLRKIREKESSAKQDRSWDGDSRRGQGYERETKRRRLYDDDIEHSRSSQHHNHRHSTHDRRQRWKDPSSNRDRSRSPDSGHRNKRRRHHDIDDNDNDSYQRSKHHISSEHSQGSGLHDRRSNGRDGGKHTASSRRRRDRSRTPSSSDKEVDPQKRRQREDHNKPHHTHTHRHQRSASTSSSNTDSSDPLTAVIGPRPARKEDDATSPRKRGRGFLSQTTSSHIDHHFSASYNPAHDANENENDASDQEDWDNALEALRDRRAWRSKQAERMREAGFGADEIERWEKSSSTTTAAAAARGGLAKGDVRDVKWRKRGEEKEWDVGKVRLSDEDLHSDSSSDKDEDEDEDKDNTNDHDDNGHDKHHLDTNARPRKGGLEAVWQRKDSGFARQFRRALG